MNLTFLGSNRFWALVGGCLVIAAGDGFTVQSVLKALEVLIIGFISIRTIDRVGDKIAIVK